MTCSRRPRLTDGAPTHDGAFEGFPTHGGDLGDASRRFGSPPDGWVDLSTGINPAAYPVPPLDPAVWQRLPERRAMDALRSVAATAYGVDDIERTVIGAGSQSLIQCLPGLRRRSHVAVVGPTYGEHQASWQRAGHSVVMRERLDGIIDADVIVLTNPNNPDGRRYDPDQVYAVAERLAGVGGLLIVDEAFADAIPALSVVGRSPPATVVLRSFGKFFGLAGLRLGFAVADRHLAESLRAILGPWPVSGPALAIGEAALADSAWIADTRRDLDDQAAVLTQVLTAGGLSVIGGTPLFVLVETPRAADLFVHLGRRGILVRPFAAQPRWLRFGLPKNDLARDRLAVALAGF